MTIPTNPHVPYNYSAGWDKERMHYIGASSYCWFFVMYPIPKQLGHNTLLMYSRGNINRQYHSLLY